MLPTKNIGIFGEYEEKHEKEMQKLLVQMALQKYIETLGDYPDDEDPAMQMVLDAMLKVVLQQFNDVYEDVEE
jgi:hypothetical protein